MDHVELVRMTAGVLNGISLNEVERIVWLGGMVHPDHINTGQPIAHPGPACPAEQVKQAHYLFTRYLALIWVARPARTRP